MKRSRPWKFHPPARATFLKSLAEVPNIALAAAKAGVTRQCAADYRKKDSVFAAAWDAALQLSVGEIERIAIERATKGYQRPIYQQGHLVGHETIYSDRLMAFVLQAHHPDYRSKHEVTGPGGVPLIPKADREIVASEILELGKRLKAIIKNQPTQDSKNTSESDQETPSIPQGTTPTPLVIPLHVVKETAG